MLSIVSTIELSVEKSENLVLSSTQSRSQYKCSWHDLTKLRLAAYPSLYPYLNSTLRTIQSTVENNVKQCVGWPYG
jgi:hypothetical protein